MCGTEARVVLIVGPGALGGLLAGLLDAGGVEVCLLARDRAQAERIQARGLSISGPGGAPARSVPVPVLAELPAGCRPELILLCVKAGDTRAAVSRLAGFPDTTVAVLQNGLGRAREVADLLGDPSRVVGVLTSQGATRLGDGEVHHAGRGPTRVGSLIEAGRERAQATVDVLRRGGLDAHLEEDLRRAIWEKLQVNAAINALTGLLDCSNGELLRNRAAASLGDEASEEVASLARALDLDGDWSPATARARWREVAQATAANLSSTLQDLRAGRRTEVFAINGAIAREARALRLRAPANEFLARLVEAREDLTERG